MQATWLFRNWVVLVCHYDGFSKAEEISGVHMPIWLQIRKLPEAYYKEKLVVKLLKDAGEILDMRLNGNTRGDYVRVRVQHDIDRPLIRFISIVRGDGPGGIGLSYQDDDTPEVPVQAQEANVQTRLRRDREGVFVEAAVVERMKKRRKEVSRKKKCANRNRRKVSETSTLMAPRRVLALSPEGSKRLLTLDDEPDAARLTEGSKRLLTPDDEPVVARLTRKKVRENVDKSLLHKGQGPLRTDDELASMEEGSRMYMDLSPVAPSVVSNHGHELNLTVLSTEPEQPMGAVDVVKSSRNGKELEKLTRLMGAKVRIEIAEGMRRPEKPVQVAKLASKGGLIARAHMPLLPHFKEYKKNPSLVQNYIGKVFSEMEEKMTAPVQEGEERKSSVSVVAEVLTKHRPSSKFLKNLEMSRQRSEVMHEEMDAMKRKAAKAEAAQAERDKSYELLLKKAEENDAKYAQLMALLGAKIGN
ncbi:hypothetical protein D1007_00894 [Hordeum vulgare]|nr:hypothetical protein D1007_00894 [Hordeum vulgare]